MWDEYAKSIGTTANNLTQQQKIQAEVNGILEESKYQVGDAAKVSTTYAGQVAELTFQFQQFKVALGDAIIPVAKAVIPGIKSITAALTELAQVFAQVTTLLFGGDLSSPAEDELKKQAESEDEVTKASKDASKATDDASDATKDMGSASKKAAKEMEGVTAGFDDINKLATRTADTVEDAADDLDDGLNIDKIGEGELFGGLKISPEVLEFVERLKSAVQALADILRRIWDVFAAAWASKGAKVIEAAKAALKSIWELLKSIGAAFMKVWENGTGKKILETILSIIQHIFEFIGNIADRLREAWEANGNGEAIWQAILDLVQVILSFIDRIAKSTADWAAGLNLEPILSAFRHLLEALVPLVEILLSGVAWAYENVLLPLASWVIEDAAPAAIELLAETFRTLYEVLDILGPYAIELWEHFLKPIAEWTGSVIVAGLKNLTDSLSGVTDWLRGNKEELKSGADSFGLFIDEITTALGHGFQLGAVDIDFSTIFESIQNIGTQLANIYTDVDVVGAVGGFITKISEALGAEIGTFASIGTTIATALFGGYSIYLDENKEKFKESLVSVFDISGEILELGTEFLNAFSTIFSAFNSEDAQVILADALQIFVDLFNSLKETALKLGRDLLDAITAPIIENKDLIKSSFEALLEPIRVVMDAIAKHVETTVEGIAALYDEHIKPFITNIKDAFTGWFKVALDGWNTYIKPVLDKLAAGFTDLMENYITPAVNQGIEMFGKLVDFVSAVFDAIEPFVTWFISEAYPRLALAISTIGDLFQTIIAAVADIANGIIQTFGGILDFLTGVFTGDLDKAMSGIADIFKGVLNAFTGVLEGFVNLFILGINAIINALNTIQIDVPEGIPFIGGKNFGFNIPNIQSVKIPRLANGAVIPPNQEFLAMLGDQRGGTNIETPLSTMENAFRKVLAESNFGGGDITITMPVYLNGREIFRDQQVISRQIGKNLVTVGSI